MKEKLKQILQRVAPHTEMDLIRPETMLTSDLGLTSMDMIMLVMEIEDEFGFQFEDDVNFQTVGDVCRYIEGHATKNV